MTTHLRHMLSVVASAAMIFSNAAKAQTGPSLELALAKLEGTLNVAMEPIVADGQLRGCTLVFDVLHQDWTYRQGAYIKVSGNFGFLAAQGAMGANLKVVVTEVNSETMELVPTDAPPTRAFLMGNSFTTSLASLVEASASDTPGALFSVFQVEPTLGMVMDGLDRKKITVAFNQGDGSTDILLPIELDVIGADENGNRTRSDQAAQDFLACLRALTSAM